MKKVKTKNYINYVGVIRDKQKWDKLLETDLFILPTYYKTEALPLSIVEAMRCGCLCISSKIGEIDELLSLQKGITLTDIDTESLIENINNCCVDLHQFKPIIINAVTYAEKEFSFSSYKNKILSAIH